MEKKDIKFLAQKINVTEDIGIIKNNLEKKYEISYGKYSEYELKKALEEKKPVIIRNHFLIGHEDKQFIDYDENHFPIERMVKAIIVEDVKEKIEGPKPVYDPFFILGKVQWDEIPTDYNLLSSLNVGEIYLPPHSAIINFLKPTDEQKKKKIVSMLDGVNINIYERDNCIENAIHEIGHLFWRDCLNIEEKKAFQKLFQILKPSALYDYEWERETEEEVFCTIYKWYMKSILMNPAFFNILEHEEPDGLALFQGVLNRIRREKEIEDVWQLSQKDVYDYINPKFDVTSNRYLRKAGLLDRIKDVEIPPQLLNKIDRYENGVKFVQLEKAVVPVVNGRIDFENMEKARVTKFKKRWKGPDGKWKYEYYDKKPKQKKTEKKEKPKDEIPSKEKLEFIFDDIKKLLDYSDNLEEAISDEIISNNEFDKINNFFKLSGSSIKEEVENINSRNNITDKLNDYLQGKYGLRAESGDLYEWYDESDVDPHDFVEFEIENILFVNENKMYGIESEKETEKEEHEKERKEAVKTAYKEAKEILSDYPDEIKKALKSEFSEEFVDDLIVEYQDSGSSLYVTINDPEDSKMIKLRVSDHTQLTSRSDYSDYTAKPDYNINIFELAGEKDFAIYETEEGKPSMSFDEKHEFPKPKKMVDDFIRLYSKKEISEKKKHYEADM